jgi:hypothetical protein
MKAFSQLDVEDFNSGAILVYNSGMPDNMTPERGVSPEFLRSLGKPATLPANEISEQAAKNFPQPEARTSVPDIRMQRGNGEEKDPNEERRLHELRLQEMYGERATYLRTLVLNLRELKRIGTDTSELDKLALAGEILALKIDNQSLESVDEKKFDSNGDFARAEASLKNSIDKVKAAIDSQKQKGGKIDGRLKEDVVGWSYKSGNIYKDYIDVSEENGGGRKERLLNNERDKIADTYKNIIHTSLDEINSLNKYLENLRNPYPYDSRWTIQFFDQALEQVNDSLRNKERFDDEGVAILKLLKRDILWASSVARVDEAMGPAFETYFDGELELSRLRTSHTELTAEDFMRVFSKRLPGEELSEAETSLVKKILDKSKMLEFTAKDEAEISKDKIGLREAAVEMQDRYGKLLYQVVGVGQKNLELVEDRKTFKERDADKEGGEHYMDVDRVTYEFLSEVFNVKSVFDPKDYTTVDEKGNVVVNEGDRKELRQEAFESLRYKDKGGVSGKDGYKVKEAILNPFCMHKRSDEIADRTFKARVRELLLNNDKYSELLEKWEKEFKDDSLSEEELTSAIHKEVDKIFNNTDTRIMNWENSDEDTPFKRLADTVMSSLNNLEQGTLASGEHGWEWKYDKVAPFEIKPSKEDDHTKQFIEVDSRWNGEKIIWKKDDVDKEVWDVFTTKILFKETKLGREGKTFFIDNSGSEKEIKKSGLTQAQWNALSSADKASKHRSYEFSPEEWSYLSSKTIDTEIGNTGKDKARLQSENGIQFFVKRISELGSIYDSHDITTVMFLARHLVEYDKLADTRSTIFPATIGWYRDLWESEPPYWRPRIEYLAPKDLKLKEMIGVEGDVGITKPGNVLENAVGRNWYKIGENKRISQKYGRYDPKAAEFVRDNVWAFVTPFLEKPGDRDSDHIVLPIFIPTQIKDMNFWRMVSLEKPSARVRDYPRKSIWHERLSGKVLSGLKWENMDKYKYSWALVTNDQMERWLGPLATPHDFSRMTADEVKKHYMMPSGLSEKEAGKRARLGGRGGLVPEGVLRATVFAQNKIITSMVFSNVTSNPGLEPLLTNGINDWIKKWVSPWLNEMFDMPSEVRGCTNYGGTAAQSAAVTRMQLEKLVRSIIKSSYEQKNEIDASLFNIGKLYK